jgi:hypothetical protein
MAEFAANGSTIHARDAAYITYRALVATPGRASFVARPQERPMRRHRFGRKIKLSAPIAIEHQVRMRMGENMRSRRQRLKAKG